MCDVWRLDMEYLAYGYGVLSVWVWNIWHVGIVCLACGNGMFSMWVEADGRV